MLLIELCMLETIGEANFIFFSNLQLLLITSHVRNDAIDSRCVRRKTMNFKLKNELLNLNELFLKLNNRKKRIFYV